MDRIRLSVLVFALLLLLSGCSFGAPPSVKKAEAFLDRNREEIETIAGYLKELGSDSAFIDNNDGTVFYNFEYHEITSEEVRLCIRRLWKAGCSHISKMGAKENNSISFEIWYRIIGDADCGVACTVDGMGTPKTEFQVRCELIKDGWFYFYDNYEEYRQHPSHRGVFSEMIKVDQTTILYPGLESELDSNEMQSILSNQKNAKSFFDHFGVVYYKQVEDYYYTILNTTKGLMLVSFDAESILTPIRMITFSGSQNEAGISAVQPGFSLQEVMRCDPDGQYDFLYASWSEFPTFSIHFFEDGNAYYIQYDNDAVVSVVPFTI